MGGGGGGRGGYGGVYTPNPREIYRNLIKKWGIHHDSIEFIEFYRILVKNGSFQGIFIDFIKLIFIIFINFIELNFIRLIFVIEINFCDGVGEGLWKL